MSDLQEIVRDVRALIALRVFSIRVSEGCVGSEGVRKTFIMFFSSNVAIIGQVSK